jgi:CHAT domain-containing protein/Tfp pilus assembly protein PilF
VIEETWPVDRNVKRSFCEAFYRYARTRSFAEAADLAIRDIRGLYPSARNWAGFRLTGFQGMTAGERLAFAESNQIRTILQARFLEEKGEFQDAVNLFEKALVLTVTVGDSASIPRIDGEIVRTAMKGKLWSKAILYQTRLIQFHEKSGNAAGLLNGLKNLAVFCLQNADPAGAAEAKLRQVGLLRQAGRVKETASAIEEMAFIEAGRRRFPEAVRWAEEANRAYAEIPDDAGRARTFLLKGRFSLETDDAWNAKAVLGQGIMVLDSIARDGSGNEKIRYDLASGIQLSGLACEKLGLYDEAIALQEKAVALFDSLSRPLQVAQGNQYLANVYWKAGNFRMAFAFQNRTLEMLKSLDNAKLSAMAHGTLGLIHLSLGDTVKAKLEEEKALDIAGQDPSLAADRAAFLKNLGLIALRQGKPDQAYSVFSQALAIDSSLGLKSGLASDYRNLGNALIQNKKVDEGILLLNKGRLLSRSLGDVRNSVQSLVGLAQGFLEAGQTGSAKAFADTGLAEAAGFALPDLAWRLYQVRATAFLRSGKEQEALDDLEKAIGIVETLRGGLKVEALQQGFLDDKMVLYEEAIRILIRAGRPAEAFRFAERAKSRNFVDLLANQSVGISKTQGALLEKERQAYQSVREAQDRYGKTQTAAGETTADLLEQRRFWAEELERRRNRYAEVLAEMQAGNPELASFVSVDPWEASKIQGLIPDSTALVEYFVSNSALFVWVLRRESLQAREVQVLSDDLALSVRELRSAILSHLSTDIESQRLYAWLVGSVQGDLDGVRHLVVIPHGILHYLPFAALQNGQGETLIERVSLSNAPSATVFGYCIEKSNRAASDPRSGSVFAVSNPNLGDPRFDLPFAGKEVASLRRTFKNVAAVSGKDANKSAVAAGGPGTGGILHFACHAEYEPETPLFSALLLAPLPGDDGRLAAQEIFGLPLRCGLVTLSACETGLAAVTQGDEIIGLTRSFLFAGTPSVVTSLWKVDDLATAVLMKRFYRYLKAGYNKDAALAKAQLLVKRSVNSHPAAWAAFGLTGDFR